MSTTDRKVAIIGSGLIGQSWTIIFSSFGYRVQLFDVNKECLQRAPETIRKQLTDMCKQGTARGNLSLEQRMELISTADSLEELVKDAVHIQECVFDSLPLKQEIFGQLDSLLGDNNSVAICSSTSIHLPSLVFERVVAHKDQCLVAHPINPPHYVKLVELIPCAETREEILIKTRLTMVEIGQKPVVLRKEIPGFALNALQYAVFQAAFKLIHDGVMTPDDVDTVVTDGLGPRYAFIGPWMTAHLNANGVSDYLDRYGNGIYNCLVECHGPVQKIEGEAAQQIVDAMTFEVPLDKLAEKRAWRDQCLCQLAKIKEEVGNSS